MGIQEQLAKLKENWLLIVLVLAVIAFLNYGNISSSVGTASYGGAYSSGSKMVASDLSYSRSGNSVMPIPSYGEFAPDVADRKITKSSSMSSEIDTGKFKDAESKLKSLIKSSGSYLLNENVDTYDSGWKGYYSGNYQIKVDSRKYNDVVNQLKGLGEVKSFNENSEDVTGSYKNLQIEINAEKERLTRYNKMYGEATLVADKIQLSDKIFEEERTIKYMEDSLKNIDQRVDYSTVYFTLNEKQPKYSNIVFVKFSELVRRLVDSINSLLTFVFAVAPWSVAALVVWFTAKLFRKKKK